MTLPTFDEAYVVSDLHIGGAPGLQMFASTERFNEFVSYLERRLAELRRTRKNAGGRDAELLLVINGDFVDFLAEQERDYFLVTQGLSLLHRIMENADRFPGVTKALQRFVAKTGSHLVVVLGNHDLELALPECREAFVQIVTENNPARRSRVELCFEGWGYRFQVAGKKALCLHGNETDMHNFTRYDELDRIQREIALLGRSEFGLRWKPSAGTQFVVDAVNPLKKQHPFVDLMHPMIPLVPALLGLINPGNLRYADEAAALTATALANEHDRPTSQRRMLSVNLPMAADSFGSGRSRSAAEITAEVEREMQLGRVDQLIQNGASGYRDVLGMFDWIENVRDVTTRFRESVVDLTRTTVQRLDVARRAAHREMARQILLTMVGERLDLPSELSDEDKAIEKTVGGQYDVVFVGHTHHRRLATRASGKGIHVNTGTWADRMTLLKKDVGNSDRFSEVYAALIGDDRNALADKNLNLVRRECPVAVLGTLKDQRTVSVSLGTLPEGTTEKLDIQLSAPLDKQEVT